MFGAAARNLLSTVGGARRCGWVSTASQMRRCDSRAGTARAEAAFHITRKFSVAFTYSVIISGTCSEPLRSPLTTAEQSPHCSKAARLRLLLSDAGWGGVSVLDATQLPPKHRNSNPFRMRSMAPDRRPSRPNPWEEVWAVEDPFCAWLIVRGGEGGRAERDRLAQKGIIQMRNGWKRGAAYAWSCRFESGRGYYIPPSG